MQATNNRILAALVVAALATSGCLGLAPAPGDAQEEELDRASASRRAPMEDLTYEPLGAVRVNFPLGPAVSAPTGPAVDIPGDTAALKFEISWRSTTGNMVWSSYTLPPPAAETVELRLEWSDGGHAATIEMDTSLHVHAPPTDGDGEFETQTETLPLDPVRGGTLVFSPTGWGDLWAIVDVSAGRS